MAFRHTEIKPAASYIGISDPATYDNAKGLKKKSYARVRYFYSIIKIIILWKHLLKTSVLLYNIFTSF